MATAKKIWDDFCLTHRINNEGVQLFDCDQSGFVKTKVVGTMLNREVLVRHADMEELILRETDFLVKDYSQGTHRYEGLIYMMHRRSADGSIIPLYIGKAETIGRGNGNLSANLCNLHKRKDKFARWGDNFAYHIGDLSAATLFNQRPEKINPKYKKWARALFKSTPTKCPQLTSDVFFWAKAWKNTDVGIWPELSPTRLAFLEYLLIGVASTVFHDRLLNYEGRNRALPSSFIQAALADHMGS
jgi:hypothetical protein